MIRVAEEKCLPTPAVRKKWIHDLERARRFVRDERFEDERLDALRNGRQYEFLRLMRILQRYDEQHE